MDELYAARLKQCRNSFGKQMTQAAFAEKLGISTVSYALFETNTSKPSIDLHTQFCTILDKPSDFFFRENRTELQFPPELREKLLALDTGTLKALLAFAQTLYEEGKVQEE